MDDNVQSITVSSNGEVEIEGRNGSQDTWGGGKLSHQGGGGSGKGGSGKD